MLAKLSNYILFLAVGFLMLHSPLVNAQTPKLEGTQWEAIHPGEIYSPLLERSLNRQFFCSFAKQGTVRCSIIATASSKIKDEQYYDLIERRLKYRKVLIPTARFEEDKTGIYKQEGNSIHIEFSAYEIEATVNENSMKGEITFNLESGQKAQWLAKKVAGENNNSPQQIERPANSEIKTNNLQKARECFAEARNLSNQQKFTEAIEKYTMAINLNNSCYARK